MKINKKLGILQIMKFQDPSYTVYICFQLMRLTKKHEKPMNKPTNQPPEVGGINVLYNYVLMKHL